MQVYLAQDYHKYEWDNFVNNIDSSSLFHLFDWKKIFEKNYNLKSLYLMAKDNTEIKGILALIFFRSKLTGNFFISLPVSSEAGICTEDNQAYRTLLTETINLAQKEGADYIEFRHSKEFEGLVTYSHKINAFLYLPSSSDELWKRFKDKVRNQIRKSEKSGLSLNIGGIEQVEKFYEVYLRGMRDKGVPAHKKEFFVDILKMFPDKTRIFSVAKDNKTIATGFTFGFKNKLEIIWQASLRKYLRFCPNHFLYWQIIKYAISNGYKIFSFGRSDRDSTQLFFKRQWSTELKTLYWQYYFVNGKNINPYRNLQLRYKIARKIWQRLPLGIVRIIGPQLMRALSY